MQPDYVETGRFDVKQRYDNRDLTIGPDPRLDSPTSCAMPVGEDASLAACPTAAQTAAGRDRSDVLGNAVRTAKP